MYRVDDLLQADGRHVLAAGMAGGRVVAAEVGARCGRRVGAGCGRGESALEQVGVVGGDAGGQLGHLSGQLLLKGPLRRDEVVGLAAEGLARPQPPGHVLVALAVLHGG